jgi:hypothetical protein
MARERIITDSRAFLEKLPKWVIVILPVAHWVLMSLRHRAAVLPSVANPRITSGGLVGEGKTEYFRIMGEHACAATARNSSFVVHVTSAIADAEACMREAALDYPIIAKPDIGWCGFGVRRIDTRDELAAYLTEFPPNERVVLQAYVADSGEAGVFYVRMPGEAHGRVLGVALRYFPQVIGDGQRTITELIGDDTRLARLGDPLHRSRIDFARVPAADEVVRLSTIGSSRVGGLYRNGNALITPQLTAAIDAIARDMDEFHFGRFDVRYASEAALMRGESFTIIEVNGAGSEAIEAWDPATRPVAAFRKIMAKQAWLFRVAVANRRRGFEPLGLRALARLHLNQQRLIRLYPPSN